ncbi:IS1/IS1595 family N-terminal zinc-binding domain-containing protein, partial [Methylomagnum sp.]
MAYQIVHCRCCNSPEVVRYGRQSGHDRFRCKACGRIFKTEYTYRACEP